MDRHEKLERLLALQAKIHRMAEWRLADIDRQGREVSAGRDALFETLNSDAPLHGLFVDAMARRLAALAREGDRLARAREAQQRRLQEEGLRLKRLERGEKRLDRQEREQQRRKAFATLLDALVRPDDDASLP